MNEHTTELTSKPTEELATDINAICTRIENLSKEESEQISNEYHQYQPHIMQLFLGNIRQLQSYEAKEMLLIYSILWEYFKNKSNIQTKALTKKAFEKRVKQNSPLVQKKGLKALLNGKEESTLLRNCLLKRFQNRIVLSSMNQMQRLEVLTTIITLVDCFDEIAHQNG